MGRLSPYSFSGDCRGPCRRVPIRAWLHKRLPRSVPGRLLQPSCVTLLSGIAPSSLGYGKYVDVITLEYYLFTRHLLVGDARAFCVLKEPATSGPPGIQTMPWRGSGGTSGRTGIGDLIAGGSEGGAGEGAALCPRQANTGRARNGRKSQRRAAESRVRAIVPLAQTESSFILSCKPFLEIFKSRAFA